ncbi:Oligopeptide-binding protein AppA [subsurface metagenome]|jgi:peptide/nickel transport system substrate-binding protein
MKNNKKLSLLLMVIMLMVISFVFTGYCQELAKELVIAVDEEIEGTDVHQVYWSSLIHELIFEPLIRWDLEVKNVVPALASSLEITNEGKDLVFKIPKGLTFPNGNPLGVEDVKKSIERYKEISPYSADYAAVQEVVIEDDETIIFKCSEPPAYIWPVLASPYSGIVDTKVIEQVGNAAFNRNAIGYGPATVEKWVQGSHITLKKNPNYSTNTPYFKNKGPLNFDEIIVRFIPDAFTRFSEFLSGNVDIVWNIPMEAIGEIEGNDDYQIFEGLDAGVCWIMVNHRNEPLNDLAVRKAISLAVNREEVKKALDDRVKITYGMLSPSQICYSAEGEKQFEAENAFNIEEAKKLLTEAGWMDNDADGILEKGNKSLVIWLAVPLDRTALKNSAPVIQAQLKQIGIDLKLREYETSYVKQLVRDHDYDLALRSYTWLDPSDLSYKFHTDSGIYSDPVLDNLLDEGLCIMDSAKRAKKYTEVQKQIFSQGVAIPLFIEIKYHGMLKDVKGVKFEKSGEGMYLNDAYKE